MATSERIPVLIVDDRPENLLSLEAVLDDLPVDVVKAHSGNEALRHALYTDFALVLLDVQMPEMDGFETAELMRRNAKTQHVPIIFVTAGMKQDRHLFKGYEAGAVDYLMKPIDPYIVRSKVKIFCELYQQRRQMKVIQSELERRNQELVETYRQLQEETTKRIRGMEDLRERDRMMVQQNRLAAMGEMLNNIAHQWRQPLNVLGLRIQHIGLAFDAGECSRDMVHGSISKAMEAVRHLSQTIDDLRDISLPEKEKVVFEVEQVIAKTLSLVQETFKGANISVQVDVQGAPTVYGFPSEFSQVLLNLLMNAKDAFNERGRNEGVVTIAARVDGDRTVVTVTDNAGGIDEELLDHVFDAYFTTKRDGKGTGLGLFMSKKIVEKEMSGTISVCNTADGAQFRIAV